MSTENFEPPVNRKHAFNAASWTFAEKWTTRLSSIVVFAILGHLLEIRAFGLVALASVFVEFLMVFADQGVSRSLVVEKEVSQRLLNTAFWISVISGAGLALLTFLLAPVAADLLNQGGLTSVLRVLGIAFVLYGLSNVQDAILQRELRFRSLAMRRVFGAVVGGASGVIAALLGAGVWSLVIQSLVAYLTGLIVLWTSSSFRPGLDVGRDEARSLVGTGSSIVGIDLFSWASRNGDNLIVGVFLGPVALGIYSVAFKIYSIAIELAVGVLTSSSLPLFARLAHDRSETNRALLKTTAIAATITAPIFAFIATEAPSLIPLLYGDKWTHAVSVVQIFCIAGVLTSVTSLDGSVLLAAKRQRLELRIAAGGTLLNVAGFLIGVHWGYQGVAVALVVRAYVYWPVRLWALHSVTGLKIPLYVKQWFQPALGALTFFIAGTSVRHQMPDAPDLIIIAASAFVGALAYLVLITLINPSVRRLIRSRSPKLLMSRPQTDTY